MPFQFDFDQMYPIALVMLQEDELLSQMRFALVPKLVKEEVFWRNYFYCVSLIKEGHGPGLPGAGHQKRGEKPPLRGFIATDRGSTAPSTNWHNQISD